MCGVALIERVQYLANTAKINKSIGLHSLRHSIATHLLQSGLTLEEVSQFLGHSSLESTQIYTHLANE
jgi:integrase/recombinase XerD